MNLLNFFALRRKVSVDAVGDVDFWVALGFLIIFVVVIFVLLWFGIYTWQAMRRSKQLQLKAKAGEALTKAASKDTVWNESDMIALARELVEKLEIARETENWDVMSQQTVHECIQQFQIERMKDPYYLPYKFNNFEIIQVTDFTDDSKDAFSVLLSGTRHKVDEMYGINDKNFPFQQVWTFSRNGDSWLLSSARTSNVSIKEMNTMTSSSED
jgi:hypothetical protein